MPPKTDNEQQPRKRGAKKPAAPAAAAAPEESYLTGGEPDESNGVPAAGEPAAADDYAAAAAHDKAAVQAGLELIFGQARGRRSFGFEAREPREDVQRNRAQIRKVMLQYIKNELRQPTTQEICEATGLSDKTVKAHKKHIKLGDGKSNIYQALTHDVIMKLFKKATGFTITAERLLTVSQGAGVGSAVERHDYELYHAPDVSAAKLWLQAIEGMSDKTQTEHTGSVAGAGGFHFEYVAPQPPANE
jgi:hypothetical protein